MRSGGAHGEGCPEVPQWLLCSVAMVGSLDVPTIRVTQQDEQNGGELDKSYAVGSCVRSEWLTKG